MASAVTNDGPPSGTKIFTTMPEILFIPEFVFGGLTWCLVASTRVEPPNPQGWVMFVSVFCFVITTLWFLLSFCGVNQSSLWPGLDLGYHFIAVLFYLSSSVALAYITFTYKNALPIGGSAILKLYQENISAVVMSYATTLLYFIHAIFSAFRWKSA